MMYTSGCPKNQNRCCQSSGSPPLPSAGLKKLVPQFRSMNSSAPAALSTGTASSSRIAVMKSDHTVMGIRNIVMPGARMLMTVVM